MELVYSYKPEPARGTSRPNRPRCWTLPGSVLWPLLGRPCRWARVTGCARTCRAWLAAWCIAWTSWTRPHHQTPARHDEYFVVLELGCPVPV